MGDSTYSDFLLDPGNSNTSKQESTNCSGMPQELFASSASVPIPGSHRGNRSVYDQFSPSPQANPAIWGNNRQEDFITDSPFKLEIQDHVDPLLSFRMDDDDIFQVDKADLIQGPTLAELNANEDTLLGDLNFDDLLLPDESLQPIQSGPPVDIVSVGTPLYAGTSNSIASNSFPQPVQNYRNCTYNNSICTPGFNGPSSTVDSTEAVSPPVFPSSQTINIAGSSTASSSTSPFTVSRSAGQSTLHELLLRKEEFSPNRYLPNQMETGGTCVKSKLSRLSMSAPTQTMCLDQIWAHREPRQHLLSTGSLRLGEAGSTSSLSTGSALSPNPLGHIDPLSHDEGYEDSDDDSEHYDDYSSDNESGNSDNEDQAVGGKLPPESPSKDIKHRKEKYFWQYNVQAKGPKGQRLVARARLENPHILNEATDPVFSPHCALRGIKHSGKARKGDGNDLTPNPRKLHSIGKELDKLSRIINDMTPVAELPFPVRPKTRKEKNKLASRACRLKKKAQHEANKIKLHGLEQEHRRLIHGIIQAKQILSAKLAETNSEAQEELTRQMEKICKSATKIKIANHSTEFVNKVLDRVKAGVPDGGIDDF